MSDGKLEVDDAVNASVNRALTPKLYSRLLLHKSKFDNSLTVAVVAITVFLQDLVEDAFGFVVGEDVAKEGAGWVALGRRNGTQRKD